MRILILSCLAFVFMGFLLERTEAKEISKDIHKSFEVSEGSRLNLIHGDGDVTIHAWDRDVLDVKVKYRATYKGIGWGGAKDFDVVFKQDGELIEVIGKEKSSGFGGFQYFNKREYTYTIRGPRYLELLLKGEDGDVEITDWEGDIVCSLDDGDVDLENINASETQIQLEDGNIQVKNHTGRLSIEGADGDLVIDNSDISQCRIELEDGDVRIRQTEGDFEIILDDGDVNFQGLKSGDLYIEDEDGDVDVDFAEAEQIDMNIRTDDGDVTVYLPPGISAAFTIDVDDGSIDIDLPSTKLVKKSRHRISGEIRDGEGRIKIETTDGNVILKEKK